MKALFDTGATKSVMSGKMYRDLKLGPLDDSNLPSVVGANSSSLGVMGCIRCTITFEKDEDKFLPRNGLLSPSLIGQWLTLWFTLAPKAVCCIIHSLGNRFS